MAMSDYEKGRLIGMHGGYTPKKPSSEWRRGHDEGKEERRRETLKDHQTDRRVFVEEREQREQEELRKLFPDSENFNPSTEKADNFIEETK